MKTLLLILISMTGACLSICAQKNPNVYSTQIGDVKVTLLSEGQQRANTRILVDASDEIIKKYAPEGSVPNASNTFLLQNSEGYYALVDAGFGRELFNNLDALNVSPEKIKFILLTHMHGDHIGGLLKEDKIAFPNARIFLSKNEYDHWNASDNASAKKILELYKDQIQTFDPFDLKNIELDSFIVLPVKAYGHTPGHTAFLVCSQGKNLLIWGDLTHAMAVQIPHPEIAVTYDSNAKDAIECRKKILKFVSEKNIPVAGMHIPYPGMGTIKKKENAYEFIPFD